MAPFIFVVETLSLFATADQKITLVGRIPLPETHPGAIGGIKCSVKLVTGDERVLVVPPAAIVKEGGKSYCHVRTDAGTHEKREVKVTSPRLSRRKCVRA